MQTQNKEQEKPQVCEHCGVSPTSGKAPATVADMGEQPAPKKEPWMTWDRAIDIAKVLGTVWVALIGTIVTMQFNERQHELNRRLNKRV